LQKEVNRTITNFEERRRLEAIAALEATAREMGFSLADFIVSTTKSKTAKSAKVPKYVHPENPSAIWTGRRRKPSWIKEALEGGRADYSRATRNF
jgi:DNA-binding protein H-NS